MAPSRGTQRLAKASRPTLRCAQTNKHRAFHAVTLCLSGHNRWSKIKHDKGKNDAAKNRQNSIFAQEIATASKLFGPDINFNPRLADLIAKAKKEGFAKASIENAVARGQGRSLSGQNLENVTIEGILPNNVGIIVECQTDNKLRTLAAVRLAIKDGGGSTAPASYLFEKKGKILFDSKDDTGSVDVLDVALEAGAIDVDETEDARVVVYAEPENTRAVSEAISKAAGLQIATSHIIWDPNEDTRVTLPGEEAAQDLIAFVDDLLEKEPNVQGVAMNVTQGHLSDQAWNDLQSRIESV